MDRCKSQDIVGYFVRTTEKVCLKSRLWACVEHNFWLDSPLAFTLLPCPPSPVGPFMVKISDYVATKQRDFSGMMTLLVGQGHSERFAVHCI